MLLAGYQIIQQSYMLVSFRTFPLQWVGCWCQNVQVGLSLGNTLHRGITGWKVSSHENRCCYDRKGSTMFVSIIVFTALWLLEWTQPQSHVFQFWRVSSHEESTASSFIAVLKLCGFEIKSINYFSMCLREEFCVCVWGRGCDGVKISSS